MYTGGGFPVAVQFMVRLRLDENSSFSVSGLAKLGGSGGAERRE